MGRQSNERVDGVAVRRSVGILLAAAVLLLHSSNSSAESGTGLTPPPSHVVVVVLENHSYRSIVGHPLAPFINKLAREGVLFTNYRAVARPSQPNYLAIFSGSTHGVTDNAEHSFTAPTLAGQLQQAGYSFKGFSESGAARRHSPWRSFADSENAGENFAQFPTDFDQLPTVSFITPSLENNMHDGSVARGDQWLERHLGRYAKWAKTHNSLLIVTFDEGEKNDENLVPTIIVGSGVTPFETGQPAHHYSLLRTIESFYELPPLGEAGTAPVLQFRQPERHADKPRESILSNLSDFIGWEALQYVPRDAIVVAENARRRLALLFELARKAKRILHLS